MLIYITYLIYISTINTKHLRTFFLLFQDVKESFKMIQVTEITLKTLKEIEFLKKIFIGNFLCKNLNTNSKLLKTQRCAQQQHVTPSCCHRGRTDNGQKARCKQIKKPAHTYMYLNVHMFVAQWFLLHLEQIIAKSVSALLVISFPLWAPILRIIRDTPLVCT